MNNDQRLEILENMRFAFQRFRSNVRETREKTNLTDGMLEDMFPWVFSSKCPLPAIQRCLDRGEVTGMELYNFMTILHRFAPEVMVAHAEFDFPKPDMRWCIE